MDLGIKGKRALVCASSQGLGKGCAIALAEAGVDLVLNGRRADILEQTADEIRSKFQVSVTAIAADITTSDGRDAVLEAAGQIDILVTNAGGPPPGVWSDWDRDDFIKALDANMLTPIDLMKRCLPAMIEQGWGRVVNITSGSVKAPIAQLGLSNSARAGLTGYVAGTARQVAPHGVVINNLLPGIHDTNRACRWIQGWPKPKIFQSNRPKKTAAQQSPCADTGRSKNLDPLVRFCVHNMRVL
jgi:3-oxoacyl-[acyl-carrier protein] reductase